MLDLINLGIFADLNYIIKVKINSGVVNKPEQNKNKNDRW